MPDRAEGAVLGAAAERHDPVAILSAKFPGAVVTRCAFAYATSFRMEELDVVGPGGVRGSYVAKYLGRSSLSVTARRAKPLETASAGRELAVYRDLLAGSGLGTPVLIGGSCDGRDGILVLERVDGAPLTEIGEFAAWTAAAAWLARMHVRLAMPTGGAATRLEATLVRYDAELLERLGRRGLDRVEHLGLGSAPDRAALGLHLDRALESFRLSAPTVVHGDLYPSNVLVDGSRVAVVDWELAGLGPGLRDLAALVSGRWSGEQRRALAVAYWTEAAALGPVDDLETHFVRLDLAMLHLALAWLGTDPGWVPPREHSLDWFGQALSIAQRLDRVPA